MKKILYGLLTILLACIISDISAQKITYPDHWSDAGFKLRGSSASAAAVDFSISELTVEDITVDGQVMKNITLPGTFLFNNEGYPNLPGNGRYIAIPQGAVAKMRITASRIETLQGLDIVPAPRIPKETETGPLEYHRNMQVYSKNAFYPAQPVTLSAPGKIRGVDVVMLGITPFQYNPVTKELRIYRDLKVEITFEGGNGHFGEDRLRSRFWDPILEDALLNYSSLPAIDYDARVQQVTDVPGYEYLIITPNGASFTQWADSIRRFRIQQGITTTVKTLTDVGGNTTTAIENYINNAYNTWTPAPAAVLLLGDYGTDANSTVISPIWNSYCVSDNIFGDVNNDDLPDVCMARMTANNAAQLQVMISKFLSYERNPPTSANFYNHPVTALGWQTERWFQICSEVTGGFWHYIQGKDPVRVNEIYSGTPGSVWSTAINTSTVVGYFGPSGLNYIPAMPSQMPCCWTGGNATGINNAINSGAFCLMHRDHGFEQGWGEPAYSNPNIDGLTNVNNQLPFIFSINCLTGKYNWASESFAEKFHRYTYNGQNSGALALIAASEVSYSFVNDTYLWGMMDNFWPNFMPTYGTNPASRGFMPCFGNAAGKYFLQQSSWPYNTGDKLVTYHLFHHHGDAFTVVYSEVPQALTVSHSSTIPAGSTTFQVTANTGSFISLTLGDQLLGTATGTGSPVSITIPGTLVVGQTMRVTVTMQNYFRYGSDVAVVTNGGPTPDFIADSTSICAGENVDFTDLTTNNPTSWSWTFPGGTPGTSTAQHPQNIVYNTPGSFSVTLTATNAISSNTLTKNAYITVNNPAQAPVTPDGDTSLCQNNSNTLYTILPVPGGLSYLWILTPDTAGALTPGDTSCIINWSDTYCGYATLKVMATNGCGEGPFSPELSIHLEEFPATPAEPSGDTAFCEGMQSTSEYTTSSVPHALSYAWSISPPGAGTIAGDDTIGTVTWYSGFSGTVSIKVKAINNCTETPWSDPLDLTVTAIPVVNLGDDITITQLQSVTLDAGNPGATYLWSNGASTQTVTVGYLGNPSDTYYVDVNINDCTGSDTVVVNYTDPVGFPEYNGKLAVTVTPNPNTGQFRLDVLSANDNSFDLSVISILGNTVFSMQNVRLQGRYSEKLDVPGLHAGVYYIVVTTGNEKVTKKIVIQN
jgi:PKD repeat protein